MMSAGARNYRFLRRRGITVRKTIDLLIGTWCIENRASLLHNDSDFHPMTRYLGLRVASTRSPVFGPYDR
jgi:predicted nucleic acid-binding protein